jgi:hypothetical protein
MFLEGIAETVHENLRTQKRVVCFAIPIFVRTPELFENNP